MNSKRFFLLFLVICFYGNLLLSSGFKTQYRKISLKFKIPTISDHHDYYILKNDSICFDENGDILILSRKNAQLYRFNSDGQYIGKSFRLGQGPNELNRPYRITILQDHKLLILNNFNQFKIFKSKEDQWIQKKQFIIPFTNIGKIISIDRNILCILTSYSLLPGMNKNNDKYFIHFYNFEDKKVLRQFFPPPISDKESTKLRSTHGNGDILLWNGKLLVVFNQPGKMFVFSLKGELLSTLSTKLPFVKTNQAIFKKIKTNEGITVSVDFANNCHMNFITHKGNVYLLTRVNFGTQESPDFKFYINKINLKQKKINSHSYLIFDSVDLSTSMFKAYSDNQLIFFNEDWLYVFNLQIK